ncbi:hypothetical protein BV20DRAFT_1058532 [Pilatotrama ljubarskyi]|nr:hypothetical protein BV20DRAFT_1058532 [Pilatotrama ljubarskyi]
MTAMNRDYRRQAKVAIVENGQRIRKMIGTDALVVSVLEVVKMYTKAEKMHERFKTFYAAQKERLTPGESIWYQEGLGSLESSMKAFEDMLADTRKRLVTFTAAFRILERPASDLRTFLRRLDQPASQRQNVLAVRPLLSRLAELHEERQAIEKQRGAMFALASATLMKNPITPELLRHEVSKFTDLANRLRAQHSVQSRVLAEIENYFDAAKSMSLDLPGLIEGTTVPLATLLHASAAFTNISDSVELMTDMYENFAASVGHLTVRLMSRNM